MKKEDINYSRNVQIKNDKIKEHLQNIEKIVEEAKESIRIYEEAQQKLQNDLGREKEKITPLVKEEDDKVEKSEYEQLADVRLIDGEPTLIYNDVVEQRKFTFLEQKESELNKKIEKAKEEETK